MPYRIIFLVICNIAVLVGCNNQSRYDINLEKFPEKFVTHFPKTINYPYTSLITTDTTSRCIYYIRYEIETDIESKLKIILKDKEDIKYKANNSNLITIKTSSDLYWESLPKIYYKDISVDGKIYYPIPYFSKLDDSGLGMEFDKNQVFSEKTTSGLSSNFTIYILESHPGNFWKGLYPLDYMPEGWKNGFSRGIAVSQKDNIIIYWFVAW